MINYKLWNVLNTVLKNTFSKNLFLEKKVLFQQTNLKNFVNKIDEDFNNDNKFNIQITDNCANVIFLFIKIRK